MQLSLRSQPPKSTLPPAVSSKSYMSNAAQGTAAPIKLNRSLTRKLTRKFSTRTGRADTSSDSESTSTTSSCSSPYPSKSGHYGSKKSSGSSATSPSSSLSPSPTHSRRTSAHDGGPLTHMKSGCSTGSQTSSSSAYDYGYGSGCYAVNLEHMYPRKQTRLALPLDVLDGDGAFYRIEREEQEFITRGLHKFSAQDYLAIL